MANIFTDGSTEIDAANLNKLISSGDGTLIGYHLFTLYLEVTYDGANYKYKLYTNNNDVNNQDYFGNLGATHTTNLTIVGDGNVDKQSVGEYRIILNGVTQIITLPVIDSNDDLNIVTILAEPNTSGAITHIGCYFRNSSGVNTDPATGKTVTLKIIGLYK